jgi:hypothetical protein
VTGRPARGVVFASGVFLAAISLTSCAWLTHRSGPPQTYYLSPSGNDSAAGTSPAAAWRSLSRASAAQLKPGMRLLLQGGGRFSGQLILDQRDGGDPGKPIQIGSYGKGRATITGSAGSGIVINDTGGIDISGLSVVRPRASGQDGDGIKVFSDLTGNRKIDHISIADVVVHGFANGISIGSLNGTTGFRDIWVRNSVLRDNLDTGLLIYGPAFRTSAPSYANQNVHISHVVASDNPGNPDITAYSSGSGIILGSVQDGTVQWSTAAHNGGDGHSRPGPEGIWAYDSRRVVIKHCLSYGNHTKNRIDGNGFGLDENTSDSSLEYNLSYGNDGAGYLIYTRGKGGMTKDNTVRFNISSGDGRDQNPSFGGITVGGHARSTWVYQNTVIVPDRSANSSAALVLTRGVRDISVWNNIFSTLHGPVIAAYGAPSAAALHLQGNDYSTATANWSVYWGANTYTSLPAWRLASGQEIVSGRPVGFTADPRLTGPVLGLRVKDASDPHRASGFELRRGSALVAAGLNLRRLFHIGAGASDFSGTALSGRHPDLGAQ